PCCSTSCSGLKRSGASAARGVRVTPLAGLGPKLALSDDREGRPDERNHRLHRQLTPLGAPHGPKDPGPHRTARQTENDVPLQPVAAPFHEEPGEPARQHSSENNDREHAGIHEASSFTALQLTYITSPHRLTGSALETVNHVPRPGGHHLERHVVLVS